MSASLPERADLEQLRRQAKELRDNARAGDTASLERIASHHLPHGDGQIGLARAQLVIARELGFASWPKLKAAMEAEAALAAKVSEFLAASVDGRVRHATELLEEIPDLAVRDIFAAAVLGESEVLAAGLDVAPGLALAIDEDRGWPPILWACYSRWHQIEPDRAAGLHEVVRLLLDVGASPNTNDGGRQVYRSALKGSVERNQSEIAEMLLAAGANPNPGQPIGEAMGKGDHRCLELLLAHGARVLGTWALGAAVFHDDPGAVQLLLDSLEPGPDRSNAATEVLGDAAANASAPVVAALLEGGADSVSAEEGGISPLRLAVRAGKDDSAAELRARGAIDDVTEVDRLIGAGFRGDRARAERLLAESPGIRDQLAREDEALIFDAVSDGTDETVALLLELGFSPSTGRYGELPLHTAAFHGNAPAVRLLLAAGAEVDARDTRFEGTPLGFATVGSGECADRGGDWVEVVRLLIEAGASRDDVWLADKPPSEEVADVLQRYGISPSGPTEPIEDAVLDRPPSVGTGVMADVAEHLEAAYRDRDIDLLASLLHPEVHWSGNCSNKEQVLEWYRNLLADGTHADVEDLEVDGDGVMLSLSVGLNAEGARPAPPQHLYQIFTIEDAQVIEIRGYPDLASALGRNRQHLS